MKKFKIGFISNCRNGYDALKFLIDSNENVSFCVTYIPEENSSDISGFADFRPVCEKFDIPLINLERGSFINNFEIIEKLKQFDVDLIFVIGWSYLLKSDILNIPKKGCVTIHPTLLPFGRGRAPIPWTILKGLKETGVTMIYMDESTDGGDIIDQIKFSVSTDETAETLYSKVIENNILLIKRALPLIKKNKEIRTPQNSNEAVYWPKRTPEMGKINWLESAYNLEILIRSVTHPYPGAYTLYKEQKIIIWKSRIADKDIVKYSGSFVNIDNKIYVAAADRNIIIDELSGFEFLDKEGKFEN